MNEVDVSVVIVNWNTRDLLVAAVSSLLATTRRARLEIVVVDNDSHDGSVEALQRVHPEVRVVRNPANLGFAKANNIGFAEARGEAFCLVNTDAVALDGVIDTLWDYLQAHPRVAVAGPRVLHGDGSVRLNIRRFPSLTNAAADGLWLRRLGLPWLQGRALGAREYRHTHPADVLSGCFLMVRRAAVDEVGALDEDFFFYGEDTDWARRFHDAGWECHFVADAEAVHLGGRSTAAQPVRYLLIKEKADLLYWRKHHPPAEWTLYLAIRVLHHLARIVGCAVGVVLRPGRRREFALKIRSSVVNLVWLLTRRSVVETPGWG